MQIIPLSLEEHFNLIKKTPISQAVFIHDYYELWMQEDYIRFLSELIIQKDGKEYPLPSPEGNYLFSCLPEDELISIEEIENAIKITTSSGVTLFADTSLEASSDNFHMRHKGLMPIMI